MGSKESSWGTTIFLSSWITHLAHLFADLKSGVLHLTKYVAFSVEDFWHTFNLTVDWLESWIAGYGFQELSLICLLIFVRGHTAWFSQIIPNFVLRNHFWKTWGTVGSNFGQPHARQVPYLLYSLSNSGTLSLETKLCQDVFWWF